MFFHRQLLDIFLEYQELIERPRIKDQLIPQCQTLMKSLKTWLKKLQNYLVNNSFTESDEEIPETLQEIYAARQLETYVRQVNAQQIVPILIIQCINAGHENTESSSDLST